MQYIGIIFILIGIYLFDSAVKNRPPVGTIVELVRDPSDLYGTLQELNGTWIPPLVIGDVQSAPTVQGGTSVGNVGENGRLPNSALQSLSWAPGHRLRPDAANAFEALNKAYRSRFGVNIPITDTYRTFAKQVALKATKGKFAATPGKSNHGWGTAVDLGGGIARFGTVQHEWMLANAPKFGWHHPAWAKQGQSTPEPWHWEFEG